MLARTQGPSPVTSQTMGKTDSNMTKVLETFFRSTEPNRGKLLAQALRNQGIEAVCFDMDGTLIGSEAINLDIVKKGLLNSGGIQLTEHEEEDYVGRTITSFSEKILRSRGWEENDAKERAAAISKSKEIEFPIALAKGDVEAFPKVIELVDTLHKEGFKLAIVTSSKRGIMQQVLENFGWDKQNYFQVKLGREDTERPELPEGHENKYRIKPDPFVYKDKAIPQLNTKAENVLVFEDSGPGIWSAHGAGAQVVAIKNLDNQNPSKIPSDDRVHRLDMTKIAS